MNRGAMWVGKSKSHGEGYKKLVAIDPFSLPEFGRNHTYFAALYQICHLTQCLLNTPCLQNTKLVGSTSV